MTPVDHGPRPPLLLCGVVSLVFVIGCACGASVEVYDCEDDEYEAWGQCIPLDCGGDNPFGSFSGADVVFVHADSDEKFQDGSEDSPFRTIGAGVAQASASGNPRVIVGIGTYDEQITLDARHDGLSVIGVCGEQVVVEGLGAAAAVLDGDADTAVHLESLTLRNDEAWGAAVLKGQLSLTDVTVDEAVGAGIAALGADSSLELTDVTVLDTRGMTETDGFGLALTEGVTATATRLTIEGSETAAIYASDPGSSLVLLGATIVGEAPDDEESGLGRGAGLLFYDGASATVFDTTITDVWDVGFEMAGDASALLERTAIVGVHPGGNVGTRLGTGVGAYNGASVTLRESTVEGTSLYGVAAAGRRSSVTLDDARVGPSAPDPLAPTGGLGLVASDGAVIDGVDLVIDGAAVAGALADDATVRLTDSEVVSTLSTEANPVGIGVAAQRAGVLDLFRVSVAGSDTIGVLVDDAEALLREVDVRDTRRGPSQTTAVGVAAQRTSTFEASDLVVSATEGPGVLVAGATEATCTDCTLRDNAFAGLLVADQADVLFDGGTVEGTTVDASQGGGTGVHVQGPGANLWLTGVEVRDNTHAAVHVTGPADVQLDDNVLIGGPSTRAVWPAGTAVFASQVGRSDLRLSGNHLGDSEGAGLFLDAASATLSGNTWSGNALDVVQQLCDGSTLTPAGLSAEPVGAVELCPVYDRPVESFVYSAEYVPPELD